MNKKIIVPIALIVLVGFVVLVSAAQNWAGESGAEIHQGWNLVYGFMGPYQLEGQSFDSSHIKAVYGFVPTVQKYVRLYPYPAENSNDAKILASIEGKPFDYEDDFSQTAFWVYSDTDVGGSFNGLNNFAEYWLYANPTPYSERKLFTGWNFVGITPDMIGVPVKNLKGSCNIEKVAGYSEGGWNVEINDDPEKENSPLANQKSNIGKGILIKVSSDCKLGTSSDGSNVAPPQIPN